jgi:type IX secretion system PorP/SprF family membrane protein
MKHLFPLICLLTGLIPSTLKAQDQTNFTQFYLNPYLINPSFAGLDGQSVVSIIYRRQWINIQGGPAIANASMHTALNPKASIGFSVTNDKKGLLNNSALLFTLGYTVAVEDHTYLRFGISAGGNWNTIDLEKFESSTDPALANILDNNASLTGNAGISLHHKLFHIGVAMPTIFSPSYVSPDVFTITEVKPFQSVIVHASNRFYFNNNNNVFEPYAIYRINNGLPSQFEVAGVVHLNHVVWAGASFKQDFGLSALAGLKLKNMLAIGASYSLKNSGDNELNGATFEVSIGYLFGKHKKGTHIYSFVNTVKEKEKKPVHHPTAAEIAAKHKQEEEHKKQLEAEAARKKQEALAKAEADRKKAEEAQKPPVTKTEPVIVKNEPVVVKTEPKKDSVAAPPAQHKPRFTNDMTETIKSPEELLHEEEKEKLQRLNTHAENPTEHHGDDPTIHPHAERHEFVKKGSHQDELEVADYVVGGVFKSDGNAKHFAEGLAKMGFKADYGHLTEKNLWYVYLIKTTDIKEARAERDRVRKMRMFRDAWLLTVHH